MPFGRQIVIGGVPPIVSRVLIDYMGPKPAIGVTGAQLLISRPTWIAAEPITGILTGFQYGFPGTDIHPVQLPTGIEQWLGDNPVFDTLGAAGASQAYVKSLAPLVAPPVMGMPLTVQMFFWIPPLSGGVPVVPSGLGAGPCTFLGEFTATPALWMHL